MKVKGEKQRETSFSVCVRKVSLYFRCLVVICVLIKFNTSTKAASGNFVSYMKDVLYTDLQTCKWLSSGILKRSITTPTTHKAKVRSENVCVVWPTELKEGDPSDMLGYTRIAPETTPERESVCEREIKREKCNWSQREVIRQKRLRAS